MNFFACFAILAVILATGESFRLDSLDEDRINGGSLARPSQFPYQASLCLETFKNGSLVYPTRCGGSIINDRWILSNANCLYQEMLLPYIPGRSLVIVVGERNREKDGQVYRIERTHSHPDFGHDGNRNAVGLVKSQEKIQFNKFVRPIPLRKQSAKSGETSVISSWGRTLNGKVEGLHYLTVKTITDDECRSHSTRFVQKYIYEGSICTFTPSNQGACNGDNGTPLATNGQLIGIGLWSRCGGEADGFTRVSPYLQWIQELTSVVAV